MTEQNGAPTLAGWRERKEKGWPATGVGVLVGLPKSAKSTLLADMPGAYVLELDEGDADHIDGRIEDVREELDPQTGEIAAVKDAQNNDVYKTKLWVFREKLKAAVKDPTIKTIGIDTLDTLAALFMEEIAYKYGVESMMVREKGVNSRDMWGELKGKFEALIEFLNGCGKLVVFATHYRPPEKDDNGRVTMAAKLNVSGASADYIAGRAKFIGYCFKEEIGGNQRYYISFKGGPLAVWGSRVKELNDKVLELPEVHPFQAIEAAIKSANEPKKAEALAAAATNGKPPADLAKPAAAKAPPKPRARQAVGAGR